MTDTKEEVRFSIGDWEEKCQGGIILISEIGSRAYGFHNDDSDYDRYGVFVRPTIKMFQLDGIGSQTYDWKDEHGDVVVHEVGKFCKLASKGNPTILNILYKDPQMFTTDLGQMLIDIRDDFLFKGSLAPFLGYATSQLKRFHKGQVLHSKGGKPNGKWAAHFFRLLWQGLNLAKTGTVSLDPGPKGVEQLKAVRNNDELAIKAVEKIGGKLTDELKEYVDGKKPTDLPDKPNMKAINDFLVTMRLEFIEGDEQW